MAADNGQSQQQEETVHHISARMRRGRAKGKLQPPLTPMIDVVFQLLLYFILTTNFQPEGLLPGTLPRGPVQEPSTSIAHPIRINLHPRGPDRRDVVYEITPGAGGAAITGPEELYEQLLRRRGPDPKSAPPVIIEPRATVRWGYAAEAYNQAVRAKFEEISFASSS